MSRQSRYRTLKENLEIEGIMVSDREIRALYVLARNPLETEHDRCNRERTSMSSKDPGSQMHGGRASLEVRMRTHGKPQVRKAPGSGR